MFAPFNRLNPAQATLLLIAAMALVRLALAGTAGLSVDEAHYALYGLHPDWSYFDHPPLIGWLQALVLPFATSDLALRLWPVVLFAGASWMMFRITLRLFPQQTPWLGFTSVGLLQSAAILQLLGLAMLPDTPLLLFGLAVLWVLHGIVVAGRVRHWLWLGALLGLAALSKYTAVTLVATVLLALAFGRQWRQLRTPWPWLAVLVALLLILPILYWNQQHDWISFLYQLHHGAGKPDWEVRRFLLSQLAQFLAYGPALFLFGLIALVASLRHWRTSGVWMSLALALPILLLFGWGGGFEMTLPHWTALAWAGLAPLAAHWLHRNWGVRWVRVAFGFSMAASLLMMAALFSLFVFPWLSYQGVTPMRELYGWPLGAQHALQLQQQMQAEEPGVPVGLYTDNWTYGSRLAWYARPAPVQITDSRYDQFDVWFGTPKNGADGLLVMWPDADAQPFTGGPSEFTACALRDRLPVRLHGQTVATFSYFACHGYRN